MCKSKYIRIANAMRNICKNDGETRDCCLNCPIDAECISLGSKYVPYNMTEKELSMILEYINGGKK